MLHADTPSFVKPRPIRVYPSDVSPPDDGEMPVNMRQLLEGFEEDAKSFEAFFQDMAQPE